MERGSRKHVLDWTGSPAFLTEFESLLSPIPVTFPTDTTFMPLGYEKPEEARLETFGLEVLPASPLWEQLHNWWLIHRRGANTPNWDIAARCEIEGKRGLILVEAKANWPELGYQGKHLSKGASERSVENHKKIGSAINEACRGWQSIDSRISISRDSHYQLANRLAFTWKLGKLGVPVVLLYLGFTGDEGIRNAGQPFVDDLDWRNAFKEYCQGVIPTELFEIRHNVSGTPVWLAVRSRKVIEHSKPPRKFQRNFAV